MSQETNGVSGSGPRGMRDVSVAAFAASLRSGSLNSTLLSLAADVAEHIGALVTRADFRELDAPSYDQDVQDGQGFPRGAERFHELLQAHDALMISSPEYNFSMPGVLKNVIDWTSRYRPNPFRGKHVLLMSASPSMAGGNRGLWALRVPLEHLGAHVYPDMFSLAQAPRMLTDDGDIGDAAVRETFARSIADFLALVEAAKHYPCAKGRWIEFLGERTDASDSAQQAT